MVSRSKVSSWRYQEKYDSLSWWGKFLFNQNPLQHTLRWRIEELENSLRSAVEWNDEYKKLNNLSGGDPYWVSWAKNVLDVK